MDYELLIKKLEACIEDLRYEPGILATAAALLMAELETINWAGFYRKHGETLYIAPYVGKPACIKIPLGKGVCGACAAEERTQLVPDVHRFPGHIACDSASRSEIVIPIFKDGALYAVMDIDSPVTDRFSAADRQGLEAFAAAVQRAISNTDFI